LAKKKKPKETIKGRLKRRPRRNSSRRQTRILWRRTTRAEKEKYEAVPNSKAGSPTYNLVGESRNQMKKNPWGKILSSSMPEREKRQTANNDEKNQKNQKGRLNRKIHGINTR